MPNYKAVDADQLGIDLTCVADAIRQKGGTSALLAFPSEFVDAITALDASGGSLPAGIAELSSGELVLAKDTSTTISVAHGLSGIPHLFAYRNAAHLGENVVVNVSGNQLFCGVSIWLPATFKINSKYYSPNTISYFNGGDGIIRGSVNSVDETSGYLVGSGNLTVPAGTAFRWIAVRFAV